MKCWKSSVVYSWTVDDVIEWLKSPDLRLKTNAIEDLSTKFREQNVSGKCFPLLSKSDQVLLKAIGVKQHLVRRKLMLKSMDAILFGPPIYDNTLKGKFDSDSRKIPTMKTIHSSIGIGLFIINDPIHQLKF